MLFILSKVVGAITDPGSLLCIACAIALFIWRCRPRFAKGIVAAVALVLLACQTCPVGRWMLAGLEHRFPPPTLPPHVDGIVVLGGSVSPRESRLRGRPVIRDASERIFAAVELARRYPEAMVLFSGGSGIPDDQQDREADWAKALLIELGVPGDHVLLERDSRNTWENALYSRRLAHPATGQIWLLVTSAWHMPRSVGCFREAGFPVIPYPVDPLSYEDGWFRFLLGPQVLELRLGIKEWVGLVSYRALGRTDALFPAPSP